MRVIYKGLARAVLIHYTIVDTYFTHQALYLLAERMELELIDIERSTLAD